MEFAHVVVLAVERSLGAFVSAENRCQLLVPMASTAADDLLPDRRLAAHTGNPWPGCQMHGELRSESKLDPGTSVGR